MTVAELIEELQKHPPHHVVVMATFEHPPPDCGGGPQERWSYLEHVDASSSVNTGPVIRLTAEY